MIYRRQVLLIKWKTVGHVWLMRRFNGWTDVDKLVDDRVSRSKVPPPSYFLAKEEEEEGWGMLIALHIKNCPTHHPSKSSPISVTCRTWFLQSCISTKWPCIHIFLICLHHVCTVLQIGPQGPTVRGLICLEPVCTDHCLILQYWSYNILDSTRA